MVLTHKYILPDTKEWDLFNHTLQHCYAKELHPFVDSSINTTYFITGLVVLVNDVPLGRLVVYHNPYLSLTENETWLIGNYACVDDATVAQYLLHEALNFIASKGGKSVIGPMNGSTWDDYRFKSSENISLFFTERYSHVYYNNQFIQAGFNLLGEYFSSTDRLLHHNRPEIMQRKIALENIGVKFRNIDLDMFEHELDVLYPFLNTAFASNYLYSPIDFADFKTKYTAVKQYIDQKYVLLAELNNEIVGVFFCLPDYLNKHEKGLVIKTIARKNDGLLKGLGHVMAELLYETAHQNAIEYMVHAFMFNQGTSVTISNNYNGNVTQTYALYKKDIV